MYWVLLLSSVFLALKPVLADCNCTGMVAKAPVTFDLTHGTTSAATRSKTQSSWQSAQPYCKASCLSLTTTAADSGTVDSVRATFFPSATESAATELHFYFLAHLGEK